MSYVNRIDYTQSHFFISLADLPEGDPGVRGCDLLAINDLGLLEPLVGLRQLDGLAVGGLVAELGERLELVFQGGLI